MYVKQKKHFSHYLWQAWIKEDTNTGLQIMQTALEFKRHNTNAYIQFISQFGSALRGVAFWNNNKTTKLVSELLTVTDEAFIHLCIINYSATWKAQEKQKAGETNVEIPVSDIYCQVYTNDYNLQMTNKQHPQWQCPKFTKGNNKVITIVNMDNTSNMPCGWSDYGLETFNKLAAEVKINRQELGQEFDKAFKKYMQETIVTTKKAGKRKRNEIETYNDLDEGGQMQNDGEKSDEEDWVRNNMFMV